MADEVTAAAGTEAAKTSDETTNKSTETVGGLTNPAAGEGDDAAKKTEKSAPSGKEPDVDIPGLTSADKDEEKQKGGEKDDKDVDDKGKDKDGDEKPQAYKINVPEGFVLDQKMVDDATPILAKYKVSNEDAQVLSDFVCRKVQEEHDAFHERCREEVASWKKSLISDKELGGKNLTVNLKTGLKALNRYGDKDLITVLQDSGLEFHPAVVRFFCKVGTAISEDPGVGGKPDGAKVSTAKMFYGEKKED